LDTQKILGVSGSEQTTTLEMNISPMQTWRIIHDLGVVSKRPKLALEHAEDYEKKKKIVDQNTEMVFQPYQYSSF
jgi:hypothetical protein